MAIAAMRTPVHSLRFLHHPQFPVLMVLALLCTGCKKDEPLQPYASSIQLKIEDASCTEVWLKVTTTEIPATMALLRDNQRVQTLRLVASDSLLIDEGLLPNHAYTCQLQKLGADSSVTEASASVQVTTMDTTSHDFTFHIDTLGVTSSVLCDVAIISENNVWAAGELYLNDSTGQLDPVLYNAAHWDGSRWEIKRISVLYRGSWIIPTLNAVLAFSATDIWFSSGVPIHGDGQNWTQYHLFDMGILTQNDGSINKIWGSSSSDLWFVGNRGTIVHYSSGTWQRIESGTTVGLRDVTGFIDHPSEHTAIVAVGTSGADSRILALSLVAVHDTLNWPSSEPVSGVWLSSAATAYVSCIGVRRHIDGRWDQVGGLPAGVFFSGVRGSAENNVFAFGWGGTLAHGNGKTWNIYTEITSVNNFRAAAVTDHLLIAVGFTSGFVSEKAIACIGRSNN